MKRVVVAILAGAACLVAALYVMAPAYMGGYQPGPLEIVRDVLAALASQRFFLALFVLGAILALTGLVAAALDRQPNRG